MEDFDYKEFASKLGFQVRPLVPTEHEQKAKDIQNIIYTESIYFGKMLSKLNKFSCITSKEIVQATIEWTFYKYIDLLAVSLPENIRAEILRKINSDTYDYLINNLDNSVSEIPQPELNKVEKLVKKGYKKYLLELKNSKIITKSDFNVLIKQSYFDQRSTEIANKNLYTVPVSIFDVLKSQPMFALAYIIALPIGFLGGLYLTKFNIVRGSIYLITSCILLYRFLTKEAPISITINKDELSED